MSELFVAALITTALSAIGVLLAVNVDPDAINMAVGAGTLAAFCWLVLLVDWIRGN